MMVDGIRTMDFLCKVTGKPTAPQPLPDLGRYLEC